MSGLLQKLSRCKVSFFSRSCFGDVYYLTKIPDQVRKRNEAFLEGENYLGRLTKNPISDVLSLLGKSFQLKPDQFASLIKKMICVGHPLSREIKNLIYNDTLNFQLRYLTVLLVSSSVSSSSGDNKNLLDQQRTLALAAEMLYLSNRIHRATITYQFSRDCSQTKQIKEINGFAILLGDLLISQGLQLAATLRSSNVYKEMSLSLSRMSEGAFEGQVDDQCNPILPQSEAFEQWIKRTYLYESKVSSASCRLALELAGQSKRNQKAAALFAKYFILAYQGNLELKPFLDNDQCATPFSVASLPILFQTQRDPELLKYINSESDITRLNFDLIKYRVINGEGVQKTQTTVSNFTKKAEKYLHIFADENTESTKILLRMIRSLNN